MVGRNIKKIVGEELGGKKLEQHTAGNKSYKQTFIIMAIHVFHYRRSENLVFVRQMRM